MANVEKIAKKIVKFVKMLRKIVKVRVVRKTVGVKKMSRKPSRNENMIEKPVGYKKTAGKILKIGIITHKTIKLEKV